MATMKFKPGDVVIVELPSSLFRDVVVSFEEFQQKVSPSATYRKDVLYSRTLASTDKQVIDWKPAQRNDEYWDTDLTGEFKKKVYLDEEYARTIKVNKEVKDWLNE